MARDCCGTIRHHSPQDPFTLMSIASTQSEGLLFHLQHIARIDSLQESERFAHVDQETVAMMLDQAVRFAEDELSPLAATGDLQGCRIIDGRVLLPEGSHQSWQQWCALGFPLLGLPPEHDGLGFPRTVLSAVQEICDGAHLAFGMLGINLRCAAMALIRNGSPEIVERYVPGLASGAIASTIAISEPQAGSDVGRILTTAAPAPDGNWLLSGSKIWISYGDHNATREIVHLVLARMPNGEIGTRGLGLFLVPGDKNDKGHQQNGINILRLEHKMGLHASPTCVVEFSQSRGYLIGEPGRGLQALFVMLNAMRLAVAVQGAAVANACTLHAIRYAQERPQGGKPQSAPLPIAVHADVRRMLLEMTAQSELARALALRTASFLDLADINESEDSQRWLQLGELLLPVAKTRNAEQAFQVANLGIQVLGGYGYTSDYPLERMARDIRVAAIYEGTSGIQSLDFLKRKIASDQGYCLASLIEIIQEDCEHGQSPFTTVAVELCDLLWDTVTQILSTETPRLEAGAYALLQLTGVIVDCWNGHTLYTAATGDSGYQSRLRAALLYHAASLPELARHWSTRALCTMPEYDFLTAEIN
jgi:3-(methylthio)propanoyl-CoA dehydrogenase